MCLWVRRPHTSLDPGRIGSPRCAICQSRFNCGRWRLEGDTPGRDEHWNEEGILDPDSPLVPHRIIRSNRGWSPVICPGGRVFRHSPRCYWRFSTGRSAVAGQSRSCAPRRRSSWSARGDWPGVETHLRWADPATMFVFGLCGITRAIPCGNETNITSREHQNNGHLRYVCSLPGFTLCSPVICRRI